MKEIIFRLTNNKEDAEILIHETLSKKEYFKGIKIKDLIKKLTKLIPVESMSRNEFKKYLLVCDENLIAINNNCIVVKQPEQEKYISLLGKSYKVNFPNSIYFIEHVEGKISEIEAYCYKSYNGLETEMFKYPMPNMLTGNCICLGSAPRDIKPVDYLTALEKVIFTQYTHTTTENIKSFKDSSKYFEYISKNDFPYDLLISLNKKLKDICNAS